MGAARVATGYSARDGKTAASGTPGAHTGTRRTQQGRYQQRTSASSGMLQTRRERKAGRDRAAA